MTSMPTKFAVATLCCVATGAWATEFGTVLSSTPVVASVPVAQQQCYDEPVMYRRPSSGAGALIGAIAGAAIGNTVGHGAGRAAATGIGMVTGAAIGDRVEASGLPPVATTAQRCSNVTRYENRTVGYDVVYEYQGVRRSVRLPQDPGDRIALDVSVTPAGGQIEGRQAPALPPPVYRSRPEVPYVQGLPPAVYAPPPVYAPPRVYVQPYPYYSYPSVVVGAGWGWQGGWHGHRRY
jgi:uncharacterized protein YcfJ